MDKAESYVLLPPDDPLPAQPTALDRLEAWKAAKCSRWYGTSEYNEDSKHWYVVRLYDGGACLTAELGPTFQAAITAALDAAEGGWK